MTAKQKAEDLILKYSILKDGHNHLVKQCALLAVEEILSLEHYQPSTIKYWENVKKEIELY